MNKVIKTIILQGKVKENPYGNWSDVDRGLYIGDDNILYCFYSLENKNIKVTIEELEDDND